MTGDEVQALLELAQSAVAEAHAETELVRAELADVRDDMAQVELERDEYRRAYHACHGWVHANPREARALGFLVFGVDVWEQP